MDLVRPVAAHMLTATGLSVTLLAAAFGIITSGVPALAGRQAGAGALTYDAVSIATARAEISARFIMKL